VSWIETRLRPPSWQHAEESAAHAHGARRGLKAMPAQPRPRRAGEIPHNMRSKRHGEDWPDGAVHALQLVEREPEPAPVNLAGGALPLSPPLSNPNIGQTLEPESHQPVLDQVNEVVPTVHSCVVGFAMCGLDQDLHVESGLAG